MALFRPQHLVFLGAGGAAARTLSGALQEAGDQAALSAAVRDTAQGALQEASDSAAGSLIGGVHLSGAAVESDDVFACAGAVLLSVRTAVAEGADGSAIAAHVALTANAAAQEAADLCAAHGGKGAVIAPGFLVRPFPRARSFAPDSRARRMNPRPRVRTLIATRV